MIDCDPGIDDALALFFALASKELKVEAVTTVYGNVGVRLCTKNLKNILSLSGLNTLPEIGIGSNRPLKKRRLRPRGVHGRDGLGDVLLGPPKIGLRLNEAVELAATKILSKEIDHIIATGPLTNIAKIITNDSEIPRLIKRIYIMGGALFVKGNITPYAEFNIYNDPEAAKIVFDSKIPKTLVGLDVTRKVILNKKDLVGFKTGKNKLSSFIIDIANFSIEYHRNIRRAIGAYMNDPLCVGVAIDEDICEYERAYLDVRLKGVERGRTTLSRTCVKEGASKTTYCKGVKAKRFKKLFLGRLKKLLKEVEN